MNGASAQNPSPTLQPKTPHKQHQFKTKQQCQQKTKSRQSRPPCGYNSMHDLSAFQLTISNVKLKICNAKVNNLPM